MVSCYCRNYYLFNVLKFQIFILERAIVNTLQLNTTDNTDTDTRFYTNKCDHKNVIVSSLNVIDLSDVTTVIHRVRSRLES